MTTPLTPCWATRRASPGARSTSSQRKPPDTSCASVSPGATAAPGEADTATTLPSKGARTAYESGPASFTHGAGRVAIPTQRLEARVERGDARPRLLDLATTDRLELEQLFESKQASAGCRAFRLDAGHLAFDLGEAALAGDAGKQLEQHLAASHCLPGIGPRARLHDTLDAGCERGVAAGARSHSSQTANAARDRPAANPRRGELGAPLLLLQKGDRHARLGRRGGKLGTRPPPGASALPTRTTPPGISSIRRRVDAKQEVVLPRAPGLYVDVEDARPHRARRAESLFSARTAEHDLDRALGQRGEIGEHRHMGVSRRHFTRDQGIDFREYFVALAPSGHRPGFRLDDLAWRVITAASCAHHGRHRHHRGAQRGALEFHSESPCVSEASDVAGAPVDGTGSASTNRRCAASASS